MLNFRYASPQSSSINIISVKTPTNIKNASLCSKNSTIKIIKNSSVFANEQPSYNYPLSASIEERKMLLSTPYLKARNSRYSITMNLSNRRSILYETDLKSSQFKEDYIKHLQKENPSLNNDNDVEITKRILQNFQKVRDKNETLFLKKIFEPLNYFIDLKENLDETSYEDCFNNLYYETAEKNKYLYRIGEPTRKIFVLVRGEVVIMMPNPKEDKNDNEYSQNKTSPSHKRNSQQIKSANDFSPPDQKFIRSYAQGDVFGDDSFNVKGERTVSAFCKEKCILVSLSSKLVKSYFEKKNKEKINLLRKIPLFKNISLSYLNPLLLQCQELHYKKGNVIYKKGDNPTFFYFVGEGEIQISKRITRKKISNEEITKEVDSVSNLLKILKYNEVLESGSIHIRKKEISDEFLISLITKGEYFGENEVISGNTRENKAVCKTRVSLLFAFPRDKFLESLIKLTTFSEIMQIFKIKSSWESDYYKKNIIFKNQKPRKMEFLPIHRRKSKSCETKFNLDEFLTPVVIKSINDLTVRKSDLEKQNPNINFLNSIDNVTSKIKQFSIESKLVPKENFISTDRINKQKNLLALFAPNTSYRTDLMIKMEEMKNKQLDKHKKRVKTLSGYNNVRRDIPENRTMDKKINEEYKENIISVILYKTLKCDKIIPNEKKIKISLQFFDKIKKDLQKKADEKCVRNTKVKETNIQIGPFYPKTKKELSKEGNDCDLFNFIGNINN